MLKLKYSQHKNECGTDEAGRGCLAGPVTAAAVVLPDNFTHPLLNDSKKLSEKNRLLLREVIIEECLQYGIAHIFPEEIDRINILKSSIKAMHKSIDQMIDISFIAVDGNKFYTYNQIPHQTIIKGDGKYMNIAAASILAKTTRDDYMKNIHLEHPEFNWKQNKGYPTSEHREAIKKYGTTKYHRKSFRLVPEQLYLEL